RHLVTGENVDQCPGRRVQAQAVTVVCLLHLADLGLAQLLDPDGPGDGAPVLGGGAGAGVVGAPLGPQDLPRRLDGPSPPRVPLGHRVVAGAEDPSEVEDHGGSGRGAAAVLLAHRSSQVGSPSMLPVSAMVSVAVRASSKSSTATTSRPSGSKPTT